METSERTGAFYLGRMANPSQRCYQLVARSSNAWVLCIRSRTPGPGMSNELVTSIRQ